MILRARAFGSQATGIGPTTRAGHCFRPHLPHPRNPVLKQSRENDGKRVAALNEKQAADTSQCPLATPHPTIQQPNPDDLRDFEHPISVEEFRRLGYQMVDLMCDYHSSLQEGRPVKQDVQPGFLSGQLPPRPPEHPETFQEVMRDVQHILMPGVVHWQSPSFFAYFPSNASFPAALADMWAGALGMVGFSWAAGPASTELERAMMDWLADLCGLPPAFRFDNSSSSSSSSGGSGGEASVSDGNGAGSAAAAAAAGDGADSAATSSSSSGIASSDG
ncbi:hypothetical protein Agub_g34, partial [Astrephomene gubernaculifera]